MQIDQLIRHYFISLEGGNERNQHIKEAFEHYNAGGAPDFAAWRAPASPRRAAARDDDFPIVVDDHGDVVDIVFNRPHVHNAYNAAMRDALIDLLRELHKSPDRPVVRLRGNGPSFCSGGDLDEFGTTPDGVLAHAVRTNRSPGVLLDAFGERAIAMVHGACIGAGIE